VTREDAAQEGSVIKVLLADDQALVRGAMAALLRLEGDIDVAVEVGTGTEAVAAVVERSAADDPIDVCLLDIEMPGLDGIETARELDRLAPEVRSLIVTTFGRPGYVRRALEAGARGFIVKDTPAPELASAIRAVQRGERVVDPALAMESLAGGPNPLTAREREVLGAALDGSSVAVIAATVHLSAGTVRNYLSSAIGKTGTSNRLEAARVAERNGWL